MSRLTDLLAEAKAKDPAFGAALEEEYRHLTSRRAFGLNFERHRPEAVELPRKVITRGDRVRVLPPRGSLERGDQALWVVKRISNEDGRAVAQLEEDNPSSDEPQRRAVDCEDLVVVARFKDRIFPGLVETGRVDRAAETTPAHTVINGENFHVLKALTYTHRGKVDAIYIDPPYNTGARDWKYNNDYVAADDAYRHSKWLAFMERRLEIARELLNPDDSVLIVTIDEKEYLRLGLLLEQLFPEADIQMVSNIINRAGSPRNGRFSRVDEYLFFVFLGAATVAPWSSTMLSDDAEAGTTTMPTVWFTAVRRGSGASRAESKNLFYPVVIHAQTGHFLRVGDPLPRNMDRNEFPLAVHELAIWPLGADGGENRWRFSADLMRTYFANGTARLGRRDVSTGLRPVTYLQPGTLENISNGTFNVAGKTDEGALILTLGEVAKAVAPRTVWSRTGHFARDHGSHLITSLVGNRRFPFPKALYAVEDTLRFVVAGKPHAVVLDFFSGSGTTAHAVMRLNKQDGGQRQCISVTNNEVGADEQRALRNDGLRPGDPEWEQWGICDYITKPRVTAAITGKTPEGQPIKGDYKFTDEFPMAEGFEANARFFTLTYESPLAVSHGLAFERVAPLLWLKAGATGRQITVEPESGWELADTYGLLTDLDHAAAFTHAVAENPGIRVAYIVTNDDGRFQRVAQRLPEGVEAVRLYESYLTNFSVDLGE